MIITCDPAKRSKTLDERGLDFMDAVKVFAGPTVEYEDFRKGYGERRFLCFGILNGLVVAIAYTPRGNTRRVFSMRRANASEKKKVAPILGF